MSWAQDPKTLMALIGVVFAIGSWVAIQESAVSALETAVAKHSKTPLRLQKLETVQGYIRKDVEEIKRIVKQNALTVREIHRNVNRNSAR